MWDMSNGQDPEMDPGSPLGSGPDNIVPMDGGKRKTRRTTKGRDRILAREQERRVLELRKAGATYAQISEQLGISSSGVGMILKRALNSVTQEPAEEMRTLQIERLNHMLLAMWPQISAGNDRAVSMGIQIMSRIDRLMGLEAPIKTHNTSIEAVLVIDGDEEAYVEAMKRMAGQVSSAEAQKMLEASNPSYSDADIVEVVRDDDGSYVAMLPDEDDGEDYSYADDTSDLPSDDDWNV